MQSNRHCRFRRRRRVDLRRRGAAAERGQDLSAVEKHRRAEMAVYISIWLATSADP
jgi:hypothetical protein